MKEMILSEEELVKRCIDNDRHAQGFLFNQHYCDLYLIAMRYMSDHHDAEDVVIGSFTRVYKYLKTFTYTSPGSLGRWIRTILINEAIRNLKKSRQIIFDEDIRYLDVQQNEANGLEQLQAADIFRMIEKLPPGYRTVFNLYVVEGYGHKEIAGKLGISENTSKTQLRKARQQLMIRINKGKIYETK